MDWQNVVLTGFMGTGKSTVGRLLAERLGFAFIDTDDLIEARDGRAIATIFAEDGEAAFRDWEARVAKELSEQKELVIATGGRMMLDPANAAALGGNGRVFCLTAGPETIVARLVDDGGVRPLLNVSNPAQEIKRLLAERAEGYGRFHQISTDEKTPDQIAVEILHTIKNRE
jgi:shikimate kinase